MDPYKYFSVKQAGNKSLGIVKRVQFGGEIFTLSSVAYTAVDFEKLKQ